MGHRALTESDITDVDVVNSMHMNLGQGGYGYGYTFVDFPRLSFRDYTYRGERAKKEGCTRRRVWVLDGEPVDSMEAALAGHANPPKVSDEEQTVLGLVPAEWSDYRETSREIDRKLGLPEREEGMAAHCYRHIAMLREKGLVQSKQVETEPNEFMRKHGLEHLARKTMLRKTPDA